jgi:hypothetical protein
VSSVHPRHAERIRKMKQRLAVRAWEYRQRHGSKGVWDRLRSLLALSEHAFAIDDTMAASLIAQGRRPHPVGAELEPAREYFVLAAEDARWLAGAREVPVQLDTEFLAHTKVALVLFPGIAPPA